MFVVDHLSHSSRYFLDGKIKITVFLTNLREKIVAQTASTLKSNMAANRGRGELQSRNIQRLCADFFQRTLRNPSKCAKTSKENLYITYYVTIP
jgi:hypothetical protein